MKTYQCSICGKEHSELPLDIAYKLPSDYFEIPKDERSRRVWLDAETNADLCVIDNSRFYIRGVLAVPLKDSSEEFRWGIWATVKEENFRRYFSLWNEDDVSNEPSFKGNLANPIREFENSDELDVEIYLQQNKQRPRFEVVSKQHSLAIAQNLGVTLEDVHRFTIFPSNN